MKDVNPIATPLPEVDVRVAADVWLRRRQHTYTVGGFAVIMDALWVWLAIGSFAEEWGPKGHIGAGVMTGIFALPTTVFAIRELRSGVRMGSGVVTVRGPFRTYKLLARDVTGFEPRGAGRATPMPWLQRTNGLPIPLGALAMGGISTRSNRLYIRALQPVCNDLDELLKATQATAMPGLGQLEPPGISRNIDRRNRTAWTVGGVTYAAAVWGVSALVVTQHPSPLTIAVAVVWVMLGTAWSWTLIRLIRRSFKNQTSAQP